MKSNHGRITFRKNLVATAVAGAIGLSVAVTSAQAATLTSLVITSGTYQQGWLTPVPNVITHFSGANLIAGAIVPTFDISNSYTSAQASSPIAWDMNGSGEWMNHFTTAASSGDETGGVMTGTINIVQNFKTTNLAQGGIFTGTGDGTNFNISWTSVLAGGWNNGGIGTYTVQGTYSVAQVPVPAAAWLMGSGLMGLVGIARRRKQRSV